MAIHSALKGEYKAGVLDQYAPEVIQPSLDYLKAKLQAGQVTQ